MSNIIRKIFKSASLVRKKLKEKIRGHCYLRREEGEIGRVHSTRKLLTEI